MKYTRKGKGKGGNPLFAAPPVQQPQPFSRLMRVQEWRDPVAQQQMNTLMANPLFNIDKIKSTGQLPVNKNKVKNFAQAFASSIVQPGPNGKPRLIIPNDNKIKRNLSAFSTALGFAPQAPPAPVKNLFGNPVYYDQTNPWQMRTGQSGWHSGFSGGKSRSKRRTVKAHH
jgi:hypothetical protein